MNNFGVVNLVRALLFLFVFLSPVFLSNVVHAATYQFTDNLDSDDRAQLNEVAKPLNKIFVAVRYFVGAIFTLVMVVSGLVLMLSFSNVGLRNKAKTAMGFAILGLAITIISPYVGNYLMGV